MPPRHFDISWRLHNFTTIPFGTSCLLETMRHPDETISSFDIFDPCSTFHEQTKGALNDGKLKAGTHF